MKRYLMDGIVEITEEKAKEIMSVRGHLASGTQVIIEEDGKIAYSYAHDADNCINRLYYISLANISKDDNNNDVVKTIRAYQSYFAQVIGRYYKDKFGLALKVHRLYYVDNMSVDEIKEKITGIDVAGCIGYFVSVAQSFLSDRETNIAKFEDYRKSVEYDRLQH